MEVNVLGVAAEMGFVYAATMNAQLMRLKAGRSRFFAYGALTTEPLPEPGTSARSAPVLVQ